MKEAANGKRITQAVDIIFSAADGDHHRQWVLDQVLRTLLGDKYEEEVRRHCMTVDADGQWQTYGWDVGIAP